MNIETTRMAMIKRAADMAGLAKSVAQTANPSRNINAANAGYAIGKALAPARNTQTAAPAPVATPTAPTAPAAPAAPANPDPAQAKGPLQRILEAGRAAYQIGQIRQDPSTVVQDAQNAERAGVFSKGLNNLIKYLSERKATVPAAPTSVPTITAPSSEAGSTEIIQ